MTSARPVTIHWSTRPRYPAPGGVSRSRSRATLPSKVSTRPRTILIVDEDDVARESLGGPLRRAHRLLRAGSGEAALGLLVREEVDLVLLDVEQPGISGFEL